MIFIIFFSENYTRDSPIGVKKAVTWEIIEKAGRWYDKLLCTKVIIHVDRTDCRQGIIPRSSGDGDVKGRGGKRGGALTIGRRFAGAGLSRGGEGDHGECMRQREEVQKNRGGQQGQVIGHGKRRAGESPVIFLCDSSDRSKDSGGGSRFKEGRRQQRDQPSILCKTK